MDNYKVYKHTFPNNKVYIGITQQNVLRRWQNGRGYYKNQIITNAILKYGWENIKHEILFENLTKEQAEQKEIELIALYKSNQRGFGYNIDHGGSSNGKHSFETIEKMRKAKLGEKNPMYHKHLSEKNKILFMSFRKDNTGKHLSEETKQKLRNKLKNRIISEETRKKMSESRKGKKMSMLARQHMSNARKGIVFSQEHLQNIRIAHIKQSYKIKCVETNIIYDSVRGCARELGIKYHSTILNAIKNNKKVFGKHFIKI